MSGPGLKSFAALWFGPYGSAGVGTTTKNAGSFRSFQSIWFGPDGSKGVGSVTPTTPTGTRKLISPAFSGTLHGDFT